VEQRTDGTALYTLTRNLGSSVGISVVSSQLTRNTQVNHADIALHVMSVNRGFDDPIIAQFWNPLSAAGRAALDTLITRQAQIIAYIDDYQLLMFATLAVIPLLIVFKRSSGASAPGHLVAGNDDIAPIGRQRDSQTRRHIAPRCRHACLGIVGLRGGPEFQGATTAHHHWLRSPE
jgi:hypothetical protein